MSRLRAYDPPPDPERVSPGPARVPVRAPTTRLRVVPDLAGLGPDQLRRAQASRLPAPFGMCPVCRLWKMEPCRCCPAWLHPAVLAFRRVARALRTR